VEFTFNNVILLRTLIMNTAPIFCKFCMKYHLRVKNGKYGDAANLLGYVRRI
jgi:hypothetical protein